MNNPTTCLSYNLWRSIFIWLVWLTTMQAQTDSLIDMAANHPSDTMRMKAYNQLIIQHTFTNTQQALGYAQALLNLASQKENYYYWSAAEKSIGNQYFLQGNFALAMEHYLIALTLMESHNMAEETAGIRHNIGNIHVRWKHPETALKYFNEARALNIKNGNNGWLINNLMSIGIVHSDLFGDNDSAIYYHSQALELSRQTDFNSGIIGSLVNIATAYINLANYEEARAALTEALNLQESLGIRNNLDRVYEKLGLIAFQVGQFGESEKFYLLAKSEMYETRQFDHLAGWHINMGNLYAAMGRYREAYENMSIAQQLTDSIFGFKEKNRLAELEAQYEIANAKKEVELARRDAIIAEQKQQQSMVRMRIGLGIGAVALIFASLVFGAYRINQRNLKLLAAKSEEINRTNNMLAQANLQLNELVQEKNNILHFVAHDLRTPLAKIRALSDLIRLNTKLEDNQLQKLDRINNAVEESSNMMQDLLDAQAEKLTHKKAMKEVVLVRKILKDVSAHHRPNARLKKIKIAIDVSAETCYTDASKFKRIADNLLSNAIKYTPIGGSVFIRFWSDINQCVLQISDTGLGFTDEDKQQMFKVFHKLSAQPIGKESSTGLGLSIVKHMTEELGATISLISEKDKGSVFEVHFPNKMHEEILA